jgi:hypothetical protein
MTTRQKWYAIWAVWILLIAVSFGVLEFIAWDHGVTLSRFVFDISEAWPLVIWLAGVLAGGLAVHFWWHWSPKGARDEG